MDAVSNVLADAAQRVPIVVVLEDLHVADVSTALLLDFLSGTVRHQPLLLLGTFREAELASAAAGPQLVRTVQQSERIALQRLSEDDVASFLRASGEAADPSFVRALHEISEGHPLFLVEVAQLWRSQGRAPASGRPAIPQSVRTVIRERLATVSEECIETLRRGAVVGREFDIGLLESCYGDAATRDGDAAQEATEAALIIEVAPQRYRFVHFLIRELVYDGIPDAERPGARRHAGAGAGWRQERAADSSGQACPGQRCQRLPVPRRYLFQTGPGYGRVAGADRSGKYACDREVIFVCANGVGFAKRR